MDAEFQSLIQLIKDEKPNDRSDKDRCYAVLITMLEKAYAYFVVFCTDAFRPR